jgi:hypothetical protein
MAASGLLTPVPKFFDFLFGQVLNSHKCVLYISDACQLIKLYLDGCAISVL